MRFVLMAVLLCVFSSVGAQPYLAAGAGSVDLGASSRATPSFNFGFRWKHAAVEAGYVGEGSSQEESVTAINAVTGTYENRVVKVDSALRVTAMGIVPWGNFALLGRVSLYRPEVSASEFSQTERLNENKTVSILASSSSSSSSTETLKGLGLGLEYRIDGGPFSVRAIADRYKSDLSLTIDVKALEFVWLF